MDREEIACSALDLEGVEREQYLDAACGGDEEMRAWVEDRISQLKTLDIQIDKPRDAEPENIEGDGVGSFETIATNSAITPHDNDGRDRIGLYELIEPLGEGGMGTVYRARQSKPVKRDVALKVIKFKTDAAAYVIRFEAERQALALMDHPNIAKILDAGTTYDGQPFFAMELVDGKTLTKYCDENRLTVPQRLALFTTICNAVQHAHQKGVVHRDLKPSNILVTAVDEKPFPKIIDFGLAKSIEASLRLTDQSMQSEIGQVLGTVKYMSPEQADLDSVDIDTRTDVYALGVILYELLTGGTPLDDESLKQHAVLRLLEIVRTQSPLKPSTRLENSDDVSVSEITARRRTSARSLSMALKGDLDWIVLKALENDRERRYESAAGFAADIERFLDGQPVEARPPSFAYRSRKFVAKHRIAVTATALTLAGLVISLAAISWSLSAAVAARQNATQEREWAEEVTRFVTDDILLLSSVEGQDGGEQDDVSELSKDSTLLDLINRAATRIDNRENLSPSAEARLREIVGGVLADYGKTNEAIEQLEKSMQIQEEILKLRIAEMPKVRHSLTAAYRDLDEIEKAIEFTEKSYEAFKRDLGPDKEATLFSMNDLALLYSQNEKYDRAIELYNSVLELKRTKYGEQDNRTLTSLHNLAGVYYEKGDFQEAIQIYKDVLELRRKVLKENHADTLDTINNLALAYSRVSEFDQAIPLFEQLLRVRRQKYAKGHPKIVASLVNLADSLDRNGDLNSSVDYLSEAFQLAKQNSDTNHDTMTAGQNLAATFRALNRYEEAVEIYDQLLEFLSVNPPVNKNLRLQIQFELGQTLRENGELERAIQVLTETAKAQKQVLGDQDLQVLYTMNSIGATYLKLQQYEEAVSAFEEAWQIASAVFPLEDMSCIVVGTNLANAQRDNGTFDAAIATYSQIVAALQASSDKDVSTLASVLTKLGDTLVLGKQWERADAVFRKIETLGDDGVGFDVGVQANYYRGVVKSGLGASKLGRAGKIENTESLVYKELVDQAEHLLKTGFDLLASVDASNSVVSKSDLEKSLSTSVRRLVAWAELVNDELELESWKSRLQD